MALKHRNFIEYLDGLNLLDSIFPRISVLKGVTQSPKYHPEGDAWIHTMLVLENLPETASYKLFLAALYHDAGKYDTHEIHPEGKITFHGHEKISSDMFKYYIGPYLKMSSDDITYICFIISNHMIVHLPGVLKKTARKILHNAPDDHCVTELLDHGYADVKSASNNFEDLDAFAVYVKEIRKEGPVIKIKPILNGIEIMDILSVGPGPIIKTVTEALLELQMEREITKEEAIEFVKNNFSNSNEIRIPSKKQKVNNKYHRKINQAIPLVKEISNKLGLKSFDFKSTLKLIKQKEPQAFCTESTKDTLERVINKIDSGEIKKLT